MIQNSATCIAYNFNIGSKLASDIGQYEPA